MKAVFIIGMPNVFYGQSKFILDCVSSTLDELGLEVVTVKLMDCYLPYYEEGMQSESFVKLADAIKDAKNIVLGYNATDGTPGAVMKVFLEYLTIPENRKLFEKKNVFNIAISKAGGEREASEYTAKLLSGCGANEITRISIGGSVYAGLLGGTFSIEAIEKYAEDYYRLIKQNRIFIPSSEYMQTAAVVKDDMPAPGAKDIVVLRNQVEASMQNTLQNAMPQAKPAQNAMPAQKKKPSFDIAVDDGFSGTQPVVGAGASDNIFGGNAAAKPFGQDFFSEFISEMPAPKENKATAELDIFNNKQEEDIHELTKLFSTKLKSDEPLFTKEPERAPKRKAMNPSFDNMQGGDMFKNTPPDAMWNTTPRRSIDTPPHGGFTASGMNMHGAASLQNDAIKNAYPSPAVEHNYGNSEMHGLFAPPTEGYGKRGGADPQIIPRHKTCKQMTASLPHYFQSQLAQDTEAIFQFNIFGKEEFSGYIVIKNKDNEYYDGVFDDPDITIIADSAIWQDILNGRFTAQKAFMTGQLKVRGNFMLLNRFDQLYKKM